MQDLHHSDIITYALTRLAGQYAREKQEILRDLRNYKAADPSALSPSHARTRPLSFTGIQFSGLLGTGAALALTSRPGGTLRIA